MSAPDIFDLLDVSRREDTYTSVLAHALRANARLRQYFFEVGFRGRAPQLRHTDVDVEFRHGLGEAGVVDLLLSARDEHERSWWLFVESKIDARESQMQTHLYLTELQRRAGDRAAGRAAGVLLTLRGEAPSADPERVVAHTHARLASAIKEMLCEFDRESPLGGALARYVERAMIVAPRAEPSMLVGAERSDGRHRLVG